MKRMNERRRKRIEKNILKNRKYKTLIYNRVILTVALVLLQIVLYGLLVASFYTSGWTVLMAVDILGLLFVLYVINRNEKPSAKLNWVIMILVLPICGISLYLLFGEGRPTRRMNKRITAAKRANAGILVQDAEMKERVEKRRTECGNLPLPHELCQLSRLWRRRSHLLSVGQGDVQGYAGGGGKGGTFYPCRVLYHRGRKDVGYLSGAAAEKSGRRGADQAGVRRRGQLDASAAQIRQVSRICSSQHQVLQIQSRGAYFHDAHEQPRPPQDPGGGRQGCLYGRDQSRGRIYRRKD